MVGGALRRAGLRNSISERSMVNDGSERTTGPQETDAGS